VVEINLGNKKIRMSTRVTKSATQIRSHTVSAYGLDGQLARSLYGHARSPVRPVRSPVRSIRSVATVSQKGINRAAE